MDLIADYTNGNVNCKLFSDGTLERTFDETKPIVVDYPTSMDIKITNYCSPEMDNPICQHCHERSGVNGKHGDLNKLLDVLSVIPAGAEMAIGGGDALSHPNIVSFLSTLKARGIIANLTVNEKHLHKHKDLLFNLIDQDLVKGIGISYSAEKYLSDIKPIIETSSNIVFHLIMGINKVSDIERLQSFCEENNRSCKVLVLGYKQFGYGIDYYLRNKDVEANKYGWYIGLAKFFKREGLTISFDNLSIAQLKLKRYFTDDAWNNFYMGDDGVFTMYVDAVKQEFAKSSTSTSRMGFDQVSLLDFFKGLTK